MEYRCEEVTINCKDTLGKVLCEGKRKATVKGRIYIQLISLKLIKNERFGQVEEKDKKMNDKEMPRRR